MEKSYLSHEIDKLLEENRKLLSENRGFRELLSFNHDLIFRFHIADNYFEYVSPTASTLTGHSPADFYQRPDLLEILVVAQFRPAFHDCWERARRGQECPEIEFMIVHPDSETLWVAMRMWPVLNRIGRAIAFIGSIRNISLQKRMEERIRALEGLIPICAGCKKVRVNPQNWEHIETYLARCSNMDFTHGLCPECASKYFPENRPPESFALAPDLDPV